MEGAEESEPPAKKSRVDGAQTATVATKEQHGDAGAVSKRKRKGKRICLVRREGRASGLSAHASFTSQTLCVQRI